MIFLRQYNVDRIDGLPESDEDVVKHVEEVNIRNELSDSLSLFTTYKSSNGWLYVILVVTAKSIHKALLTFLNFSQSHLRNPVYIYFNNYSNRFRSNYDSFKLNQFIQ